MFKKTTFLLKKTSNRNKNRTESKLDVYVIPVKQTEYKDELNCLFEENPIQTRVLLTFKAARPKVDLEADNIDFEKFVINQSRSKYFKMKNVREVNYKWILTDLETSSTGFKLEPLNIIIGKGKEVLITVTFCSEK